MKAQLRIGETAEDRRRIEAEAETIRQATEAQPVPEYRHYYGNWGLRIPMVLRAVTGPEKTTLLIDLDRVLDLQDPSVRHEIEHHTEKLNQALTLTLPREGPVTALAGQPCRNCDLPLQDCRAAPERGFQGGCCPECDHKAEAQD